ncbi:hypothetical protein B0H14DRAFT_2722010, partial [Mycena olivaceomarginata]
MLHISGDFLQAIDNLNRGRIILGICGLAEGGYCPHNDRPSGRDPSSEIRNMLKPETIHSQIRCTVSPGQNAWSYAVSLLNIAHIDLNQAKEIFNKLIIQAILLPVALLRLILNSERKKFELAKVQIAGMSPFCLGKDNEIGSLCLERLLISQLGQVQNGNSDGPTLLCLGDVFIVNKDGKTAENLYMLALEGFTQMDIHCKPSTMHDPSRRILQMNKDIPQRQFPSIIQATDVSQIDDQESLTILTAPDQWLNMGSSKIQ